MKLSYLKFNYGLLKSFWPAAKTSTGFTFFQRKKASHLLSFSNQGFTLIEMVIYVATLAIVAGVILVFLFQALGVNETSRRTREAVDNAKRALDVIAQEIRHASSVYTPTSIFGTNPGQLSLETVRDLPADEVATYVDFYIDNQRLYIKRESQSNFLVTSEKVRVTNLTFTNLSGTAYNPSVRVQITVEYDAAVSGSAPKNAVTLSTTASLRSYE